MDMILPESDKEVRQDVSEMFENVLLKPGKIYSPVSVYIFKRVKNQNILKSIN